MAVQVEVGIGIHFYRHALTGPHIIKLVLLEIGGDPHVRRNNGEDLLSGCDVGAHFHVAPGYPAILRGRHDRPRQIERPLIKQRLCLLDLPVQLLNLRIALADMLLDWRTQC